MRLAVHNTSWQEINAHGLQPDRDRQSYPEGEGTEGGRLTHATGGDDGVLEHATAQLATKLYRGLFGKHLRLLGRKRREKIMLTWHVTLLYYISIWIGNRRSADTHCVFLFLVKRESGAEWHVRLGMQGANGDGRVRAARGTDGWLQPKTVTFVRMTLKQKRCIFYSFKTSIKHE